MSNVTQTQSLANDFANFYQAGQAYIGMKFNSASALGVGSGLVSWQMSIRKVGNPSGTLYARLYGSSSTGPTDYKTQSINTFDVADDVTTSYADYNFNFSGTTTIASGDYVVCFYDEGDGSSGDYLQGEFQDSDVYDSTDSVWITNNGGPNSGADAKFVLVYTAGSPTPSSSLLNPPQVAWI